MTEFKITEGEGKRYLLSTYHQLSQYSHPTRGTSSPILQRRNRGWERFNPLPKAIVCVHERAGIWALMPHCRAHGLPRARLCLPPNSYKFTISQVWTEIYCTAQRWLHLRTGECVGRGTYIMCAWTKLVIHKAKKRPGPIPGYETLCHSFLAQRTLTQNPLPMLYLPSSCLKDPSLLLDLPHRHSTQHQLSFSALSESWLVGKGSQSLQSCWLTHYPS